MVSRIYAAINFERDLVKIGVSTLPRQRVSVLKAKYGIHFTLVLSCSTRGYKDWGEVLRSFLQSERVLLETKSKSVSREIYRFRSYKTQTVLKLLGYKIPRSYEVSIPSNYCLKCDSLIRNIEARAIRMLKHSPTRMLKHSPTDIDSLYSLVTGYHSNEFCNYKCEREYAIANSNNPVQALYCPVCNAVLKNKLMVTCDDECEEIYQRLKPKIARRKRYLNQV